MAPSIPRPALEEDLLAKASAESLLIVTGPRGSGKTALLAGLERRSRDDVALAQLEPIACSPEVLRSELRRLGPPVIDPSSTGAPMEAVVSALRKQPAGSLLLLDDVAEIRTLSYYPDVERPLEAWVDALSRSKGAVVATTRFSYWMRRAFPDLAYREVPPIGADDLRAAGAAEPELVAAITGGLVVHAARLAGSGDVETALVRELTAGGGIEAECRATMAELLHRARGYGACKSVLRVLADEQHLRLTEVARRFDRTPGSTRDYLRWLEEVDLVVSREKRYSYVDPILRLWVRLYATGAPPSERELRQEVTAYIESVDVAAPEDDAAPFTFPPAPSGDLVEID